MPVAALTHTRVRAREPAPTTGGALDPHAPGRVGAQRAIAGLDRYDLAYLAGGERRVVLTAALTCIDAGAWQVRAAACGRPCLIRDEPLPPTAHDVEHLVLSCAAPPLSDESLAALAGHHVLDELRLRLEGRKLLRARTSNEHLRRNAVLVVAVLTIVGAFAVAWACRSLPVGYASFLIGAFAVNAVDQSAPQQTDLGREVVAMSRAGATWCGLSHELRRALRDTVAS